MEKLYKLSISKIISMFCGIVSFSFGLIVIFSWYLKINQIIQISPKSPPMYYNVALGFLVAGLSLTFLSLSKQKKIFRYFIAFSGIFLVTLGVLSLTETFGGIDFKIDQLFVKVYADLAINDFPGRPSTPTSLLFILTGISLFLININQKSKMFFWLEISFSFLILVIAICTILGYLANSSIIYSWVKLYSYMSINTTFCFIIIGIGIISKIFHISQKNSTENEKWVSFIVFLTLFFITFLIWLSLLTQDKINNKKILEEKISSILQTTEMSLNDHVFHMEDLVDQLNANIDSTPKEWQDLTNEYLNEHKTNQEVAWLDKNFIVKKNVSLSAKNSIKQQDIKNWTWEKNFIKKKDGKFDTSLTIPPGLQYKKISIWVPIYSKGKLVGSILDLLDTKTFIEQIINKHYFSKDIEVNVFINGRNVYSLIPKDPEKDIWFLTAKDNFYGSNWEIGLGMPASIFSNMDKLNLHNAILICGFLFSLLFSSIINFSYISRRKNIALEDAKVSLLKAQKIAKMGSWVWDLNSGKIYCSPETFSILGINPACNYLTSSEYFKFINATDSEQFKDLINELKLGKPHFSIIHKLVRRDSKELIIRLEASVSKFLESIPVEITGIIQDVTEQKNLEMELQQSQKMEMIGQLTGGLAHDFNNLLMVIRGNLELMSEELTGNSKQSRRINLALQAIARGSDLIKRLLSFSRRQTLHSQCVKFQEIIPEFVKLLKPTLGESIDIHISLPEETWPVLIDASQFENSLLNLAVNARDAMDGTGKLFLDFKNVDIKESLIIGKEKIEPGEYVKISVADTGHGMSDEVLQKIFEPFFTTKEVGKGTGLGLCMVYGFIKQSQGYIFIESKIEHGTTINLYLPKSYLEQKKDLKTSDKNNSSNIGGSERILLVEDEEVLLEMTKEYLENLGYQVLATKNGVEALNIFKKSKNINLLLTDVIMPNDLTGPNLAAQLMQIDPNLKILFVTGYPKSELSEKNIKIETFEVLTKPYSMNDLGRTIRKILDLK